MLLLPPIGLLLLTPLLLFRSLGLLLLLLFGSLSLLLLMMLSRSLSLLLWLLFGSLSLLLRALLLLSRWLSLLLPFRPSLLLLLGRLGLFLLFLLLGVGRCCDSEKQQQSRCAHNSNWFHALSSFFLLMRPSVSVTRCA